MFYDDKYYFEVTRNFSKSRYFRFYNDNFRGFIYVRTDTNIQKVIIYYF